MYWVHPDKRHDVTTEHSIVTFHHADLPFVWAARRIGRKSPEVKWTRVTSDGAISLSDQKFSSAVRWSLAMNGSIQAGNVLTTFILASELGAEAFGLVALASFLVLLFETLVDPGLTTALIQRTDLRDDHLNSVFWTIMVSSLVLMGICNLAADWWASYNHATDLANLARVLSIAIPIRGLGLVQQAVLMRDMDFRSLAIRTNAGIAVGVVVGIAMAFGGFGAWSIVGQQLSLATVSTALVWKLSVWRPRLAFQFAPLRELWGFTFGVFLQQLGNFCYSHAETAVMGYWFSTQAVGLYRFSYRLVNVGVSTGTRAVNIVSLPAFVRQQSDPDRLRQSTLQSIHSATVVTFALLVLLAANIDFLLPLLKTKWSDVSTPMKLLCIAGAAQVISMIGSTALQATGRSYSVATLAWFWGGVALLVAIAVGYWKRDASVVEQITALALSRTVVAVLLHVPVYVAILNSVCRIRLRELMGCIAPSALSATACLGSAHAISATGLPDLFPKPVAFILATSIDSFVFFATLAVFDPNARMFMQHSMNRLRQRVLA